MWILQWLPDWIFYALIVVGLVGFFLTYFIKLIPISSVYVYKTPIQIASLVLVVLGVYMSGAISNEEAWKKKVSELETKLAQTEVQSVKENVKVVQKVVTKQQIVKERGEEIIKYVDREVVRFDTRFLPGGQCEIPKEFISAHNKAAEPLK